MGSGATQQRYTISGTAFTGSLSDLASRVAINQLLRHTGTRFIRSLPLPDCPGEAGLAYFRGPKLLTEAAFGVENGRALTAVYERPIRAPRAPEVDAARRALLCVLPA